MGFNGSILAKLGLDTAGFQKDLKVAGKSLEEFAAKQKKSGGKGGFLSDGFASAKSGVMSLATGFLGAGLAAGALLTKTVQIGLAAVGLRKEMDAATRGAFSSSSSMENIKESIALQREMIAKGKAERESDDPVTAFGIAGKNTLRSAGSHLYDFATGRKQGTTDLNGDIDRAIEDRKKNLVRLERAANEKTASINAEGREGFSGDARQAEINAASRRHKENVGEIARSGSSETAGEALKNEAESYKLVIAQIEKKYQIEAEELDLKKRISSITGSASQVEYQSGQMWISMMRNRLKTRKDLNLVERQNLEIAIREKQVAIERASVEASRQAVFGTASNATARTSFSGSSREGAIDEANRKKSRAIDEANRNIPDEGTREIEIGNIIDAHKLETDQIEKKYFVETQEAELAAKILTLRGSASQIAIQAGQAEIKMLQDRMTALDKLMTKEEKQHSNTEIAARQKALNQAIGEEYDKSPKQKREEKAEARKRLRQERLGAARNRQHEQERAVNGNGLHTNGGLVTSGIQTASGGLDRKVSRGLDGANSGKSSLASATEKLEALTEKTNAILAERLGVNL